MLCFHHFHSLILFWDFLVLSILTRNFHSPLFIRRCTVEAVAAAAVAVIVGRWFLFAKRFLLAFDIGWILKGDPKGILSSTLSAWKQKQTQRHTDPTHQDSNSSRLFFAFFNSSSWHWIKNLFTIIEINLLEFYLARSNGVPYAWFGFHAGIKLGLSDDQFKWIKNKYTHGRANV